jgi:hypothetical protein
MSTEPNSEIGQAVNELLTTVVDFKTPGGLLGAMVAFTRGLAACAAAHNAFADSDLSESKFKYNIEHSGTIFDVIESAVWLSDENSSDSMSQEMLDESFALFGKLLGNKLNKCDIVTAVLEEEAVSEDCQFIDRATFAVRRLYVLTYLRIALAPLAHAISEEMWDSFAHEFYESVQKHSVEKTKEIITRLNEMSPPIQKGAR